MISIYERVSLNPVGAKIDFTQYNFNPICALACSCLYYQIRLTNSASQNVRSVRVKHRKKWFRETFATWTLRFFLFFIMSYRLNFVESCSMLQRSEL